MLQHGCTLPQLRFKENNMYRSVLISIIAAALCANSSMLLAKSKKVTQMSTQTLYDFSLTGLNGKPLPFDQFKGKAVLLVNTASLCGFTPQYEGLEKLQTTYAAKGFTVVGVPSGDFGGQEYDSSDKIATFCRTQFGINFPMAEKAVVKGDKAIPLFKWATDATNSPPKWNFHKYLIGRDGKPIAAYGSNTEPQSKELIAAIDAALAIK
jgi:glutathione peroxidase